MTSLPSRILPFIYFTFFLELLNLDPYATSISYLVLEKAQEIQSSSNRFNLPHKFQESIYICYISYNFSPPELIFLNS